MTAVESADPRPLPALSSLEPARITVELGERPNALVTLESLQGFGLELRSEIGVSFNAAVNVFRALPIHREFSCAVIKSGEPVFTPLDGLVMVTP